MMSLAAAVLLSLGFGYGLGWWWQGDQATNPIQMANDSKSSSTVPSPTAVQDKVETVPYYVSDSANGMRQVALPVVQASDLGPDWQEQLQRNSVSDDVLRELRSKGMNVRHRRTVQRVELEDGRVMYVPTDYFYEELFP